MDLISVYKNRKINFQKLIKDCLRSAAAGKRLHYYIPDNDVTSEEIYSIYQIRIDLDEKKDADIIKFLDNAKPRQINALIRSVMRAYIVAPLYFNCLKNPNTYEYVEAPEELIAPPLKYQKKSSNKKNTKKEKLSHNINDEQLNKNTAVKEVENNDVIKDASNSIDKTNLDTETTVSSNNFFGSIQGMLSQFS